MERRLAAILAADVVGYSRLMAADEEGTLAGLRGLRAELMDPTIAKHHGRIVKLMGDGALVEFASVVDAVRCAVEIQRAMAGRAVDLPEDQRIRFRIGVNLGDVIIAGDDIYGDGVNIAARLEGLAEPGGIVISGTAFDHAKKTEAGFRYIGRQQVKNIPEAVRAYRIMLDPATAGTVIGEEQERSPRRRWLTAAAVLVVILAGGGVVAWLKPWQHPPETSDSLELPEKPSIAVLPFENVGDDAQQGYFADGLTDDLITELSKISGLLTIARNSVFNYKDKALDIRQVAKELGVRYVLQGSVRRAGEQLRINAQLIDGTTGSHVWAERYDRKYADIFALQDEVIGQIIKALSVQLTETEQSQVARLPTESLEAYDYYLRAEQLAYRADEVSTADALAYYDKAIASRSDVRRCLLGLCQGGDRCACLRLRRYPASGRRPQACL